MVAPLNDQEIIGLFFERSEQAISELDRRYGTLGRRIAENILASPQDAEECVNDAYLGFWNAIPPEKPQPLSAYLCRVVRNLSIKRYHANTAQKRNGFYDAALEELEDSLSAAETPDTLLSAGELTRLLNDFLASLSREERRLFLRRYWFSEPVTALARELQISENNVSVRLSRIRGRLRAYLRKEGYPV